MKTFATSFAQRLRTLRAWTGHVHVGVGVVALLCVFLISINVQHALKSRAAAIASNEKALLSIAQSAAGHASVAFGLADTIAHDLALEFETYGSGGERVKELQQTANARAAEIRLVKNVVALDEGANVIFRLRDPGAGAAQFQQREFFIHHRDHRERTPYVSHPVRAFSDQRWVVPVSRRFDRPDGSFAGVVVALIDQSYFDSFHRSLGTGETDTVALYYTMQPTSIDGKSPASNGATPPLDARLAALIARDIPRRSLSGVGIIGAEDVRGQSGRRQQLYAFAHVYSFGQTVVVTRPLTAALSAWDAASRVATQSATVTTTLLAFMMLALFLQVRGRRAAEGAMQRKDHQFALMLDGVEDYGIFMLDTAGRVVTWNVGAERVTGYPAGEVIGTVDDVFCLPGDRVDDRAARILATALAQGREENEGWHLRRDGTRFLVNAITTPLHDNQGAHYGYLKVLRDITTARKIAEHLQASEVRWKYALEGAGEGVWDVDITAKMAQVSVAYQQMLGYSGGGNDGVQIDEADWAASLHPDDLPRVAAAYLAHRNGETPNYAAEYRIRCADGSYKWVLSRGMVASRDGAGRALRIIGTHADISHLKSIEERLHQQNALVMEKNAELEQASRVKSEFLANMSHELRTPLNAVLGFTGTILMELPGPLNAEQRKQLEIVRESGRHLLDLINELLDLSKIESGNRDVALKPVACQALLQDVVRSLMPLAAQKQLVVDLLAPDDSIDIMTDAKLLKQILINLIGNAIKFTESGSVTVQLRISTSVDTDPGTGIDAKRQSGAARDGTPGECVWIDVQDTGIGIREEDIGKLFLPFTQIEAALSRRFEGTGLGLNVSKRYAEMLGASLHVTSRYGQGSRFSICLPARIAQAA